MAGFDLHVWYSNTPEDRPQVHLGVTWSKLQERLKWLLNDMEQTEGVGDVESVCEICGLPNPGPEHRAYAPQLCSERPREKPVGVRRVTVEVR